MKRSCSSSHARTPCLFVLVVRRRTCANVVCSVISLSTWPCHTTGLSSKDKTSSGVVSITSPLKEPSVQIVSWNGGIIMRAVWKPRGRGTNLLRFRPG